MEHGLGVTESDTDILCQFNAHLSITRDCLYLTMRKCEIEFSARVVV